MKVYIETLFLFNAYIDFICLYILSIILKVKIDKKKILISSLIGGISSLLLFLKISLFKFLILQIFISYLIVVIAFDHKKILFKIFTFYFISFLFGGIILALNNIFKLNTLANFLVLTLISTLIALISKKEIIKIKTNYNLNYQITFNYKNQKILLNSFFDTGNNLIDPYFHKPVILVDERLIDVSNYFYIPYNTITESGVIKAILVENLEIIGLKKVQKVVIGLLPKELKMKDADCLLNIRIMEELNA